MWSAAFRVMIASFKVEDETIENAKMHNKSLSAVVLSCNNATQEDHLVSQAAVR